MTANSAKVLPAVRMSPTLPLPLRRRHRNAHISLKQYVANVLRFGGRTFVLNATHRAVALAMLVKQRADEGIDAREARFEADSRKTRNRHRGGYFVKKYEAMATLAAGWALMCAPTSEAERFGKRAI
jgi:hypothetical protein